VAGDTLASLGQKLTDLFASLYAAGNPDVSLGFLPFSAAVPDDIVQAGVINPAQMAAFLTANFDYPFVLAPGQNTAFGRDDSYGPASQIYNTAVTLAQPAVAPGSDAAKRLNAEIAMAQSVLSPAGVTAGMTCQPDDWVATGNTSYWTDFDSTQIQTPPASPPSPGPAPAPAPVVNPQIWTIRRQPAPPAVSNSTLRSASPLMRQVSPAVTVLSARQILSDPVAPDSASPAAGTASAGSISPAVTMSAARPMLTAAEVRPAVLDGAMAARPEMQAMPIHRVGPILGPVYPPPTLPTPPAAPASSTVTIHFAYMSVTVGYTAAGLSIWDGVFLADPGWYISGMARGGLLPSPNFSAGATPLVYGLPVSLIIVRDVTIAVQWSGQDQASLGTSGGFLGPFSLSGISPNVAPDGTWTYTRPGMQVVAVLASHLPVLPPVDAPDLAPAAGAAQAPPATPAPAPAGPAPAPVAQPAA
jgi:hypothetical protein